MTALGIISVGDHVLKGWLRLMIQRDIQSPVGGQYPRKGGWWRSLLHCRSSIDDVSATLTCFTEKKGHQCTQILACPPIEDCMYDILFHYVRAILAHHLVQRFSIESNKEMEIKLKAVFVCNLDYDIEFVRGKPTFSKRNLQWVLFDSLQPSQNSGSYRLAMFP